MHAGAFSGRCTDMKQRTTTWVCRAQRSAPPGEARKKRHLVTRTATTEKSALQAQNSFQSHSTYCLRDPAPRHSKRLSTKIRCPCTTERQNTIGRWGRQQRGIPASRGCSRSTNRQHAFPSANCRVYARSEKLSTVGRAPKSPFQLASS